MNNKQALRYLRKITPNLANVSDEKLLASRLTFRGVEMTLAQALDKMRAIVKESAR